MANATPPQGPVSLQDLPHDLATLAASHLSYDALLGLARTSKYCQHLVEDPRAWQGALASSELPLPRGFTQVLQAIASGQLSWHRLHRQLSLVRPAATGMLVAPRRMPRQVDLQRLLLEDPGSSFPKVLPMDGQHNLSLTIRFPVVPAGKYQVVWHLKLRDSFQRGYINFFALFSRTQRRQPQPPIHTPDPDKHNSDSSRSGHPQGSCGSNDAAAAWLQRSKAGSTIAAANHEINPSSLDADVSPAAGHVSNSSPGLWAVQVTGTKIHRLLKTLQGRLSMQRPPLGRESLHSSAALHGRPGLVAAYRSWLLGQYHSSWKLFDRQDSSGRSRTGALESLGLLPTPSHQQQPEHAPPDVAAAAAGGAGVAAGVQPSSGWQELTVGSISLHSVAQVDFKFVMLQVASLPSTAAGPTGVLLDYIELRPVGPDTPGWLGGCFQAA